MGNNANLHLKIIAKVSTFCTSPTRTSSDFPKFIFKPYTI